MHCWVMYQMDTGSNPAPYMSDYVEGFCCNTPVSFIYASCGQQMSQVPHTFHIADTDSIVDMAMVPSLLTYNFSDCSYIPQCTGLCPTVTNAVGAASRSECPSLHTSSPHCTCTTCPKDPIVLLHLQAVHLISFHRWLASAHGPAPASARADVLPRRPPIYH
jgi:hypothetical protein